MLADLQRHTVSDKFHSEGFSIDTTLLNLEINDGMTSPCNRLALIGPYHRFCATFLPHRWTFLNSVYARDDIHCHVRFLNGCPYNN